MPLTPEHEEIWQEETWTFHSGSHVGYEPHAYVDYCVFQDGEHYPGYHCPHGDEDDPGWTVQQK
jgi:hypothetical protein